MNQQEIATNYLKNALNQNIWKPGDRLPGLKSLGKEAGVSHFTMAKAVHCLVKENLLTVAPSSGIRVSQTEEFNRQTVSVPKEKWKKVRTQIANDLFGQILDAASPLPSIQELCHRYSASYPILKKALCSLEEEGLLISYKRTYKPDIFSTRGHTTKLLVLVSMYPDRLNNKAIQLLERGFHITNRGFIVLHELERLCNAQNLSYDLWGYFSENDSTTYISPDFSFCSSIEHLDSYYGICILKANSWTNEFPLMLTKLAEPQIPIAILDDTAEQGWTIPRLKNKDIRIFPFAFSDLAGQKIGQFLLQLKHREIAFISPWQKEQWSQNRYQGLCKAFSMVSELHRVNLFADNRYPAGKFHLQDKKIDEAFNHLPSLDVIVKPYNFLPDEQAKEFASEMDPFFYHEIGIHRLGIFLKPLFEKALANKNITAWVCADDRMALLAIRFLRKKNIAIPQEISVVGFEDVNEAYNAGLTTFNFDYRGLTQTMVAFLSNPAFFPIKQGIIIEKPGFMVPRQSTGPVRKEIGD